MYDIRLCKNFKIFACGPSRCGKTCFIIDIIQNIQNISKAPPNKKLTLSIFSDIGFPSFVTLSRAWTSTNIRCAAVSASASSLEQIHDCKKEEEKEEEEG